MDSLSQLALGAAIGVAAMGRRAAAEPPAVRRRTLWKAAAWGAVAGTLPDLDVLIDHGDPVANMVLHRAETHALFWLTLFSLPFGWLVAWLSRETVHWRRWWLAMGAALVTHPLLDAVTVYGTQLLLPWTNHPFGIGSLFIIDPLYTLPLLAGTGATLATRRLRPNTVGLVLSCAYVVWSIAAQQHVHAVARDALAARGIAAERVLVTPTAFNTVLWRVVAVERDMYHEGFHSLLDGDRRIAFDRFDRGAALYDALRATEPVQRIAAFSHGFFALRVQGDRVVLSDLRMGQEPNYVFSFAVADARSSPPRPVEPIEQVGSRPDVERTLPWLWRRMLGHDLPPPR